MKIKQMILFLILLSMMPIVLAEIDYTASIHTVASVNTYEGERISDKFSVSIINNGQYCDIQCNWWIPEMNLQSSGSFKVEKGGTQKTLPFDVKAQGTNGIAIYTLHVNCDRITSMTCWSNSYETTFPTQTFSFLYAGDGICTTEREKCTNYNSYIGTPSDCACSSDKQCNPTSSRGADSKGCATYCGNKKAETSYETCSNCPVDIGKCDGDSCYSGTDCEGKFCVHSKCSHTAYITGDTYCDKNQGETCKNSASDCSCGANQRCGSTGTCETYCGNGVCEESEKGICNTDCRWCGDGTCQDTESCSSCSDDCGQCKQITKQEEVQRNQNNVPTNTNNLNTQTEQQSSLLMDKVKSAYEQNKVLFIILGIIFILMIAGIVYELVKKTKSGNTEKKETITCPKCHKTIKDSTQKFCQKCGNKLK